MIAMPITATKTYNEIVSSDPSIEAGLLFAGYTAPTVQGIRSWFGNRVVCDDANFKNYFLRLASPLANKYNAQLRLETADKNFDPFVENYLERYIEHGGQDERTPVDSTITKTPAETTKTSRPAASSVSESPAETSKSTRPAASTVTESPAVVTKTKTPSGYTLTETKTTVDKTLSPVKYTIKETVPHTKTEITFPEYDDEHSFDNLKNTKKGTITTTQKGEYTETTTSDNDTKGLSKQNPISSTSASHAVGNTGSDEITGLGWDYSSAQEQATVKGYNQLVHKNGTNSDPYKTEEDYGSNGITDTKTGSEKFSRTYATGKNKEIREITNLTEGKKEYNYSSSGSEKEEKTPGTKTLSYTQGSEGMSVTTPGSKSTTFSADGHENLTVVTAGNKATTYTADGREVTTVQNPETVATEYDGKEVTEYGRNIKERVTGRASLTPQQALSEAITYLRTISPAFFDLMVKLEPAFLGVYDI